MTCKINTSAGHIKCFRACNKEPQGIKKMPGYREVLSKAREYDRVITLVQKDEKYQKFTAAKALFKSFCIDSYRNGKSPIDLLTDLQLDAAQIEIKGTTEQRASSKIEKFHKKLGKHLEDPVVFTVEQLTNAKLQELYGELDAQYKTIGSYTIPAKGTPITHAYYREVKKGDEEKPGLVRTLKKDHPEFVKTPELIADLKAALKKAGVKNEKTFDKIDTIAAKANKPKTT